MSTLKVTNIQHPNSDEPNIILNADGTITAAAVSPDDVIAFILALGG